MRLDVVIAGVGGQGTILASRAIAQAALDLGLPVRTSETLGMAQREGIVSSHIRIGEPLFGAVIPDGGADVLLGFELAETVRWFQKLKPGGRLLANRDKIVPVSVYNGRSIYDSDALESFLLKNSDQPLIFDAFRLAEEAGNYRATNMVFLGAFSTLPDLPFSPESLLSAGLALIPGNLKDINSRAFELGRQAAGVYFEKAIHHR